MKPRKSPLAVGTAKGARTNSSTRQNGADCCPVRQLLPPPQTGIHGWLFGCASYLRREGYNQFAALSELSAHVAVSTFRAGRTVTTREIADAVESAYRDTAGSVNPHHGSTNPAAIQDVADYHDETGWPAEMHQPRVGIDRVRLDSVIQAAGKFELNDLWLSDYLAPRWALGQLFSEADLLCIGYSASNFAAKPLRDWAEGELLARQFIVPNPLRKFAGTTKRGNVSAHSRDATGARRYLIVESDAGLDADQQAQVLEHLRTATQARLAAVVLSGGKSVHGWFRCDSVPSAQLHAWFSYAVTLGADPRMWLPEQFVRLPDGLRENGARQSLIFLNPSA